MKIFYAVQATGNGHISRAMELLPYLRKYGTVDIFLSGNNAHLSLDAPVKYRSKGLSLFYNASGGLHYGKILAGFRPLQLYKETGELPVEKYDLVINDFEFITSMACARKKVPSIALGHQASFQSPHAPRPIHRNRLGEWVLKNYGRATHHMGLHFEKYDEFILPPVIKNEILQAVPVNKGHITVYLPAYSSSTLRNVFRTSPAAPFHIFSKDTPQPVTEGHITWMPVDKHLFNKSLIECEGIVCGAGFETPAEALYLGKKIIGIPARGQYEQLCNAAALEQMGVSCTSRVDAHFPQAMFHRFSNYQAPAVNYGNTIPAIMDRLLDIHARIQPGETFDLQEPATFLPACQLS